MTQALTAEPATVTPLPPYSSPDVKCAKCSNQGAFTKYRDALGRPFLEEHNGTTVYRGPLPERLERACERCDYTWDEALQPAVPELRPATIADVVHALEQSHSGWALNISPGLTEHMADALLAMLQIDVRTDHPVWQPAPAQPPLLAPVPGARNTDPEAVAVFVPGPQQPGLPTNWVADNRPAPTTSQTGPLLPPGGEA
ncbi:hypothetical protein ACFWVB_02575 [Streptomyces microflavus]|uniref:hypothetical protein n=1 Tax=Streptomyces microflavus TaxID=1919 RepID=UPI00365DEC2A